MNIIKNSIVMSLIMMTVTIFCMDKPALSSPVFFKNLPNPENELNRDTIILILSGLEYPNFQYAADFINHLAENYPKFNTFLNKPSNLVELVHNLSKRFHCSDMEVYEALNRIEQALQQIKQQNEFDVRIFNQATPVITNTADPRFTIDPAEGVITPLNQPIVEKQKKKKTSTKRTLQKWVPIVGNILLGKVPVQEMQKFTQGKSLVVHTIPTSQKSFADLPGNVQVIIMDNLRMLSNPNALDEVAKGLKTLSLVNKELNNLINNPEFALKLIKTYSRYFDTDNKTIAQELDLPAINKQLLLQKEFNLAIANHTMANPENLKKFRASDLDWEFTDNTKTLIGKDYTTPAEKCILAGYPEGLQVLIDKHNRGEIDIDLDSLYQLANILTLDKNMKRIIALLEAALHKTLNKKV